MKRILVACGCIIATATMMAQGTSSGGTYTPKNYITAANPAPVNAPVYEDVVGTGTLLGPAYQAQVYMGLTESSLAPVGVLMPFLNKPGTTTPTGYFSSTSVSTSFAQGAKVFAQVGAFPVGYSTFEAAVAAGAKAGKSTVFQMTLGGDNLAPPVTPQNLSGLTSFAVVGVIPEPAPIVLGLLGAAFLLLRRRS